MKFVKKILRVNIAVLAFLSNHVKDVKELKHNDI